MALSDTDTHHHRNGAARQYRVLSLFPHLWPLPGPVEPRGQAAAISSFPSLSRRKYMIKSKRIWTGAAMLALVGAVPAIASAQSAPDSHAGHHPAEAATLATPMPSTSAPTTPTAKPDGMMGGGPGMMNGMGAGQGDMPKMGMMGDGAMPMGCMAGGGMAMGGNVEGHIASLRTELKITGAQTGAWNSFAGVLRANARRVDQLHMGMMTGPNGAPPSLTQRLDRHERLMTVGLDNLRALKLALVRLYAVLSVGQQATADRLLMHEMMPGMQMGGMPMSGMPAGMPKQ
jgi:hypothetical protein